MGFRVRFHGVPDRGVPISLLHLRLGNREESQAPVLREICSPDPLALVVAGEGMKESGIFGRCRSPFLEPPSHDLLAGLSLLFSLAPDSFCSIVSSVLMATAILNTGESPGIAEIAVTLRQ